MKRQQDTTCPYCGVGCGVTAQIDNQQIIAVSGSERHPANRGKLCVKGSALRETLQPDRRLVQPVVDGEKTDWDTAIEAVAERLQKTIRLHGPDSVAFYVSGQLLTEDYYVANKLMKGFIGSGNIDTNSRLCMSSAVAGYKRAFGSDTVPASYEDLTEAELMVMVGSNAAWTHPVLYQRMQAARLASKQRMVVIDPRRTTTAEAADLHLPIKPGTDAVLFNGLLAWLADHGHLDNDYIESHTEGFSATISTARRTAGTPERVAEACDITLDSLLTFYHWFARTERTVSFYSMGINQSSSGVDKANAIINTHLATGRVGKPGASPFSITGQPNAMGGREVGGLANQLAAHMEWDNAEDVDRVARFWQASRMASGPGLSAVDLFDRVACGEVKAIWIMATNPAVSMPEADRVREALAQCDTVIVSDCMAATDTLDLAHIKLPATGWSEKDGTVTNSERRISRQRALVEPTGEARHDWWIITQVARAMGFADAFSYQSPVDIFREHAQLSAYENAGRRDFDLSAWADITRAEYDALTPLQWPVNAEHPMGRKRLFHDGRFFTPSGRARFIPINPRAPQAETSHIAPFRLNTGRLRDQWHTMTRTGVTPRLGGRDPEPRVSMHPQDMVELDVRDGDWLTLENGGGQLRARVAGTDAQRRGELFVPIHWTAQYASSARVDSLIPAVTDPISGQPELKHAVVAATPWRTLSQGYCWMREVDANPQWDEWVRRDMQGSVFYQYAMAGHFDPVSWCRQHWPDAELQQLCDEGAAVHRIAVFVDDCLQAVIWQSPELPDLAPDWVANCVAVGTLSDMDRRDLLAGHSSGASDPGPVVCSCHQIGQYQIETAIAEEGCHSVGALGRALKCGTECGSCVPDLESMLANTVARAS